ncbi:acetamidase/formamidase [Microbacterium sp. ZKA21]|uniref:acetamidase/formamidase family protein n=1 Tax=Microbacterium sp. ZKA21 TaxID=3381694 RepID=UPI003D20429E
MSTLLDPGRGVIRGEHYLPCRPDEVGWGWLPTAASTPALTVRSGDSVTLDTLSHEGILADQGRDPRAFLAAHGRDDVLRDAIELAESDVVNTDADGPHVVTGPVAVAGARPGDVLRVDIRALDRRVDYGFISNRHGFGALPGEYPLRAAHPWKPDLHPDSGTVSHFCWVEEDGDGGGATGRFRIDELRSASFRLAPFLGLMGVAGPDDAPAHSVPPGPHGGNIDIKHLVVGSSLYLPIRSEGALFFAGDPHFAQGNGEVALTALEASLRATLTLTVVPAQESAGLFGALTTPFGETPEHWIPTGMAASLDEAMRVAVREAIRFLAERFEIPRQSALAYLSAAGDFEVSQVVDGVVGVHCLIPKRDWRTWA